ncbi:LLM class flavin-dependent oxidoreductase [Nocardioides sp. Kera G14]|uniref:LLM class flavin-dependent oxidoreductase n=1 Tax=Nocardioides sp. Kera G14 TaxID=2884264 RepID=UPI001D11AC16|nr:LLM class flavin-dependent oxidoreductase [Nocardioides sp. Kera G14]UDY23047.1 LLM class flavin-dependent oxidoreductase [Nocardioides sp. Kera G14]
MTELKFHWFIPTNGGDGRSVVGGGHGVTAGAAGRPASVPYLGQIARSAEQVGFEGALIPTGPWCEDAWVTSAMLTQASERLKFLVAFRPDAVAPYVAAQMAATYVNLTDGRLMLNVVTGGEDHDQRMYGDFLNKEERYARCDEFLTIVRRLWAGETVDFTGRYLSVEDSSLQNLPDEIPAIYFGGSSAGGIEVAAKHADVYLTWGEPPAAVREKIERARAAAERHGRELRFGVRLHSIARETAEQAWAEAARLLDHISDDEIARMQAGLRQSGSEGQRRMLELNGGSKDNLEIHPNLWAGVGLVRGGAGTALVGSYAEIADLIEAYVDAGISEFVLSGYPHLEEAYWFGEGVLPELERRGLWSNPVKVAVRPSTPFGAGVTFGGAKEPSPVG